MNDKTDHSGEAARNEPVEHATDGESITLPNGLTVRSFARRETEFVYREIFEERVYMRHGITLPAGATVFDVGANVGLFTLFARSVCPDARVLAFEPSPRLLPVLRANLAQCGDGVEVHGCGLGATDTEAEFTFYPQYTILSGFHADREEDEETLRRGVRSQWQAAYPDRPDLQDRHLDALIGDALEKPTIYRCPIRRISSILRESNLSTVDLLKIDVEKSEFDVLLGVDDGDWPGIRQVGIEVHDPGGQRLAEIRTLLTDRGFTVAVETEPQFKDAGIANVFAVRD